MSVSTGAVPHSENGADTHISIYIYEIYVYFEVHTYIHIYTWYIYVCVNVLNETIYFLALNGAGSDFGVQAGTLEGSLIRPCIEYQAL